MTGTGAEDGVRAAVRRGSPRLLVVRHAKADHPEGVADHERALTERGERDARALGSWLAEERFVPDVVVVSTAVRARRTWELAAEVLGTEVDGTDPEVHVERRVYEADADTLLAVLREVGGDAHTVALVGHEPGVSTLVRALAGWGRASRPPVW